MKLEEAIKILTGFVVNEPDIWEPDEENALKLGIEAFKAVERNRKLWGDRGVPTLSGETK